MSEPTHRVSAGAGRRAVSAIVALIATIAWSHALAAVLRAAAGLSLESFAPSSASLTIAAAAIALAGVMGGGSARRAGLFAAVVSAAAVGALTLIDRVALVPVLALVPVGVSVAVFASWLSMKLPVSLDEFAARRPRVAVLWTMIALVAVVQVGRLSTYMSNAESDWFLTTRHPFYAKHECASAYFYGAELSRRGVTNVYDSAHYPGLNPDATPETEIIGMTAEDPYQYAPQFLLWPRMAIALTNDFGALRLVWFGINVTLCMAAVALLAAWIGGWAGRATGLLAPLVLASFPVLHNFQYGQFHFAAIALAVLAMLAFHRGRTALGGGLLAVSILSKLFPAVLLIVLAVQKRWRALAWTGGAAVAISLVALAVLGTSPFVAFFDYHLPRLGDGSAFAFGEAWPEVAMLLTAGNQGIAGIVDKLSAMGLPVGGDATARTLNLIYSAALFLLAIAAGLRTRHASRHERAIAWVALVGMASLSSTGAWADYVPLACVWMLALIAPLVYRRPFLLSWLVACGAMQMFLIGTMPLGQAVGAGWMMPLSLFGALAMLISFVSVTVAISVRRTEIAAAGRSVPLPQTT